jgi:chorismate--pyruvate lyase
VKIIKDTSQPRYRWLVKPLQGYVYQHWLIDKGSLTARLQKKYPSFSVRPLAVEYAKPIQDEAALLNLHVDKIALVREVLLLGNGMPAVFAHSVLPRRSLRGLWHGLGRLGNKPLGAMLFANPKIQRTPLSYKKLSASHALYQQAVKYLDMKPPYLWARRSVFSLNCANIMVTEVFLPHIIAS